MTEHALAEIADEIERLFGESREAHAAFNASEGDRNCATAADESWLRLTRAMVRHVTPILAALRRPEPGPRPEADEGAVDYDIPDQLERLADYLAPLHGAWVARTAARELRDGRSRYRAVASALCRERGLVPDELISDAGHEVWELVGHEAVQKESAALAAAQEGVK